MWQYPLCPHPWGPAGLSSYGLWVPYRANGHSVNAYNLPISQTLMPLMRKLMLNFCHFWIHDLVRSKMTGVEPPTTLLSLVSVPALLWHPTSLLMYWSRAKLGHLPLFSSCWEVGWSWGQVLIMEIKWCWCRWDGTRAARPPGFNVSFSDGLGDQLLAISQAYWFGTELGLFANPTDGSWQGECGTPHLTQTQSFS